MLHFKICCNYIFLIRRYLGMNWLCIINYYNKKNIILLAIRLISNGSLTIVSFWKIIASFEILHCNVALILHPVSPRHRTFYTIINSHARKHCPGAKLSIMVICPNEKLETDNGSSVFNKLSCSPYAPFHVYTFCNLTAS